MDAREFKLGDVLDMPKRYVVPLYQRQYQWHDHRKYGGHTAAFWLDVAAKATELLEGEARFDHYIGALLLAPHAVRTPFGATPVVQVVDGQQRLTTALIMLAALREAANELEAADLAERCQRWTRNRLGHADDDPLAVHKLMPTPVDRDIFFSLMEGDHSAIRARWRTLYWGAGVPQSTPALALRAYEFFRDRVLKFARTGVADEADADRDEDSTDDDEHGEAEDDTATIRRLHALLEALVFRLKLIVIELGPDDDAQVIFQTLNSAGKPLLAMDLVRNAIFQRAEAQHRGATGAAKQVEALYESAWKRFDASWWRADAPNARPVRPRIDHFLAAVLTAETGNRVTVRELYAEYRAWSAPKGAARFSQVEAELDLLTKHAPVYETLEGEGVPTGPIAWLGERLRLWQVTSVYPVALQLAEADEATCETISRWLDGFFARRVICRLTAKNYNNVFQRMAAALRRNGVTTVVAQAFLAAQDRPTTRTPSDAQLRRAIIEDPLYGSIPSRVLVDLLWSLELESRSKKTEATQRPPSLWVEHIMPQNWRAHWPLNNAATDAADARDVLINSLGNLTIVTDRLNVGMGDRPFAEKRKALVEHSNLTLNREIAQVDVWDEDAIRARGARLADIAVRLWPSADPLSQVAITL